MESEFIALDKCGEEAEWLRHFLEDVPRWPKPCATVSIHCDSHNDRKGTNVMYNEKRGRFKGELVGHNSLETLAEPGKMSMAKTDITVRTEECQEGILCEVYHLYINDSKVEGHRKNDSKEFELVFSQIRIGDKDKAIFQVRWKDSWEVHDPELLVVRCILGDICF
ncbi:hypothetical protein FNV43_RR00263 [Rhamnella rubrinervis]|uniref:Uncharacterized protein n=1 Tax=Rhamnella rubrinervis TaxID=2594499 RepID=A0A8K0HMI5_9ROSA|nr:hypothetical protein FNV43_RR00263 [Rhamnella rubrinervis]